MDIMWAPTPIGRVGGPTIYIMHVCNTYIYIYIFTYIKWCSITYLKKKNFTPFKIDFWLSQFAEQDMDRCDSAQSKKQREKKWKLGPNFFVTSLTRNCPHNLYILPQLPLLSVFLQSFPSILFGLDFTRLHWRSQSFNTGNQNFIL